MRMFLISDNIDTKVGMKLAGVYGIVVHTRKEILDQLEKAINDKQIGIILITEKNAEKVREELNKMKVEISIPLFVEIPDRHGTTHDKDRITNYIKESIGIKL